MAKIVDYRVCIDLLQTVKECVNVRSTLEEVCRSIVTLVIVKYGVISLSVCIFIRLRLVKIRTLTQ